METPNCPVCGKVMIYNAEGLLRNPKAPTFKCSDRDCKFQFDKIKKSYVLSEYITGVWVDDQGRDKNPPTGQNEPLRASGGTYVKRDSFPKKEIKTTMDYKAGQIQKAQDAKEESIKIASSGRDAVLIVTSMYKDSTFSDEQMKAKITEWRDWMYKNIYTMDDATYKALNVPF